jgi:uncharacterized protein with FMN-binding domain
MLRSDKKRESLAGKLLVSSALVAVSLVYGWWQRNHAAGPSSTTASALQPNPLLPVFHGSAAAALATPTPPVTPEANATPGVKDEPSQRAAAPQPRKSVAIAKAGPQAEASSVAPSVPQMPSPQSEASPSSLASSLTTQQAMRMNLPTDGPSPPLPLITGAPDPGIGSPAPAGTHLADGDFVSDRQEMAWGDLRVKISVHGGLITGVQILQYPDHRSQSLYLSQMAAPILESEVIKSQKAQVDTVSSATDTSYSFQDTIANAIMKATRE